MGASLTLKKKSSEASDIILKSVASIGAISGSTDEIDVTTLDSPNRAKEYISGAADYGSVEVEQNVTTANTDQIEKINTLFSTGDLRTWERTDDTGTVYVYGMTATNLGYGATNDKSFASLGLAKGDNITIIGFRYTHNNEKPECVYAYFVKKNSSGSDTPEDPGVPSGSGTADDPYNVAAVKAYTMALEADVTSEEQLYAKGIISSIKNAYEIGRAHV